MTSQRAQIFLVESLGDAERLQAELVGARLDARPHARPLPRDENGRPVFQGCHAAVICVLQSEEEARQAAEAHRASRIAAVVLEHTFDDDDAPLPHVRLVAVHRGIDRTTAAIICNALLAHGIGAVVSGAELDATFGGGLNELGGPEVLVAEEDAADAKQILATLLSGAGEVGAPPLGDKSYSGEERLSGNGEYVDDERSAAAMTAWPLCPSCRGPRLTICPICHTAGSDFPRADANFELPEVDAPQLALICTSCDEPWAARFVCRCEWCDHDFGEGIPTPEMPVAGDVEPLVLNGRAAGVIAALLILAGAAAVYFLLLVSG